MKNIIKSKKAVIFPPFLLAVAFVSLLFLVSSFMFVKKDIDVGVSPNEELLNIYNKEKTSIFLNEESLKLSAQQDYYDIANKGAVEGDCKIIENDYVEWNAECKPDNEEIKNKVTNELKVEDIANSVEEKSYINYKAEYTYNPSVEINIEDININLDFEEIYDAAVSCKNKDNAEVCMNKINNWDTKTKISGDYLLFDLSTKKNFFFSGKFEPITLKFALKI